MGKLCVVFVRAATAPIRMCTTSDTLPFQQIWTYWNTLKVNGRARIISWELILICIPRMIMRFLGRSMISGDIAIMIMRRLASLEIAESMLYWMSVEFVQEERLLRVGCCILCGESNRVNILCCFTSVWFVVGSILRMIYMMVLLATEQLILCIYSIYFMTR